MKPYYETENGKLYHGDCLEIMPQLEKVDLVLTDPPYGIEEKISKGGSSATKSSVRFHQMYSENNMTWDKIISNDIINLIIGKSKNQIIFGGNYYNLGPCRCFIVYDKISMRIPTMSDCEYAWTSFDKPAKIFKNSNQKNRVHPTQKPVGLFKQILLKYSSENQKILDPFLGSGTTAIAVEEIGQGREWIGIEREEKYCEIAAKRIEQGTKQQRLPGF